MNTKLVQLAPIDSFWCVEPGWAKSAQEVLSRLDLTQWAALDAESAMRRVRANDGDEDDRPYERTEGGTAILSMAGPLTKKATSAQSLFGGTSTIETQRALREAVKDPEVKRIALHIDSPGGQVSGTADLADAVAKANKSKPVMAYISDMGASAAYWIASQASAIYANTTAMVGSIGVFTVINDMSQAAAEQGVKVHVVRAGKFKGSATPGTEVTESQLAEFQREIDAIAKVFIGAVAKGRGISQDAAASLADGRVHIGASAKKMGLIDGVMGFEDAVKALEAGNAKRVPMAYREDFSEDGLHAGLSFEEHSEAVLEAVRGLTQRAEDVSALRAAKGGCLSDERAADLREIHAHLGRVLDGCQVPVSMLEIACESLRLDARRQALRTP